VINGIMSLWKTDSMNWDNIIYIWSTLENHRHNSKFLTSMVHGFLHNSSSTTLAEPVEPKCYPVENLGQHCIKARKKATKDNIQKWRNCIYWKNNLTSVLIQKTIHQSYITHLFQKTTHRHLCCCFVLLWHTITTNNTCMVTFKKVPT
jgi:hypothetical protein